MSAPGPPPAEDMAWVPGGTFLMGSEDFYPEERPVRSVAVDGLWMDTKPVTAAQFRRFVRETGYVTVAERPLDPQDYPDADPELLVPGSLVFRKTAGPVPLDDVRNWWEYAPGASWKRPGGPGTTINGRDHHPVVQVAFEDAAAYAAWAGKELPTEAEWEHAARGGLEGAPFVWGDEELPGGEPAANTWQGRFPWENLKLDGYEDTSPVGSFPANGYGLYDMAGNVWEWTTDFFAPDGNGGALRVRAASYAGRALPAPRDQGRLAPLCAQLLPALPAGSATERDRGHVNRPHRVPLHRARVEPQPPRPV